MRPTIKASKGASFVEYALLAAAISIGAIGAAITMGHTQQETFTLADEGITDAARSAQTNPSDPAQGGAGGSAGSPSTGGGSTDPNGPSEEGSITAPELLAPDIRLEAGWAIGLLPDAPADVYFLQSGVKNRSFVNTSSEIIEVWGGRPAQACAIRSALFNAVDPQGFSYTVDINWTHEGVAWKASTYDDALEKVIATETNPNPPSGC